MNVVDITVSAEVNAINGRRYSEFLTVTTRPSGRLDQYTTDVVTEACVVDRQTE